MQELYFSLSFLFLLILGWIAYEDYKTKLIPMWLFYLLNIFSLVWIYFFWNKTFLIIMVVYFIILVVFEVLDYLKKRPKFLSEDWMIWDTGFYDYWFYLFLIWIFIAYLSKNFVYVYLFFSLSIIIGFLIGYFLTKKKYSKWVPLFVYAFFIILFLLIFIYLLRLY